MGKCVFLAVCCLGLLSFSSAALGETLAENRIGVGLSLGAPTGVTARYDLSSGTAVEAHIGAVPFIAEGFHGSLLVGGSYVVDLFEILDARDFRLSFSAGAGAAMLFNVGGIETYEESTDQMVPFYGTGLAGRVPISLNLALAALPLRVHLEVNPSAALLFPARGTDEGSTTFSLYLWNLAAGARYYF